jgi:cytochrome c biogenesis protein CcmG, thiol:disulfide interchange protein DsbE
MVDVRRRRCVATVLGAPLAGTHGAARAVAGNTAPALPMVASDGHAVLAEAPAAPLARATWLDFWASWCTPCKLSFPWLNEMHDRYAPSGLRIVGVGLDRREADATRFLQQMVPRFAIALDPAAGSAAAMAVQAMPSGFLIGQGRRVLHVHRGFRLQDRAALEAQFRQALL